MSNVIAYPAPSRRSGGRRGAKVDPLIAQIVDALVHYRGQAHRDLVCDYIASVRAGRSVKASVGLRTEVIAAFRRHLETTATAREPRAPRAAIRRRQPSLGSQREGRPAVRGPAVPDPVGLTARMHTRHGARVNIGLSLEVIQAARRGVGGDIETCLIFAAILVGNAAPLDENPALARQYASGPMPDDLRRPMRIQRLSESLNLARETTRSKAASMIAAGLVEQTEQGLIVPAATLSSAPMMSLVIDLMACLDDSLQQIAGADWAGLKPGERLALRPFPTMWGAMRALTQHVLRGVVDLRSYAPPMSLMQAYLLLAVFDRSVRRLSAASPVLYADHADAPPASALERVTAQGLASFLGLPRETVRRNMQALVRLGALVQEPGGYAISPVARRGGSRGERQMQESSKANLARLVRRLRNIDALTTPSDFPQG